MATGLLMLPAVVNGFPFLFYDTGGYLDAAFAHVVKPGRSIIYGLVLLLGSQPFFWPVALAQCALTVWILGLVLRAHGLGGKPALLVGITALLTFSTALPFVAALLMPDIFAGLAGLSLYLLLWQTTDLRRREAYGLVAVVVIGGASHNSVLAIAILCIATAALAAAALPVLRRRLRLSLALVAVGIAILATPVANFALAGRFAGTPGGTAFVFGRLLQDGIVARYLADNCPLPGIALCAMRDQLPTFADDFLWDDDEVFNAIGGFEGGEDEMRRVVLGSLAAYPLDNIIFALRATARQLVEMNTGDLMADDLPDSYDVIREVHPRMAATMMAARQQQDPSIEFSYFSRLHVPVGLAASALLAGTFIVAAWRRRHETALFAGSVCCVLVANAAVCGILSNPHDRYQSRIVWIAVAALFILAARAFITYLHTQGERRRMTRAAVTETV